MRRVLAVLALLTIGVGLASAQTFAKAPSLAALNVQLSDLPAGSGLFFEQQPMTPAAAAKIDSVKAATYVQLGVLRADDRVFVGGTKKEPVLVIAAVYACKSAAAAHGFYLWDEQKARKASGAFTRTPLTLIGDEGLDFSRTRTTNGKVVSDTAKVFRRGGYVVELAAGPATKVFSASELMHLARLVDTRIQHAG